jgi:UV DNA damage repair endonuclease
VIELIPIINEVWRKKGMRVKQHLSEPRPGAVTAIQKRAHADRCHNLPGGLPDDVDLMIEVNAYRNFGCIERYQYVTRRQKTKSKRCFISTGCTG